MQLELEVSLTLRIPTDKDMRMSISIITTMIMKTREEAIIIFIQWVLTWEDVAISRWSREAVTSRETLKKKWEISIAWRQLDRHRLQSRYQRITLSMMKWVTGIMSRVKKSRLLKNNLFRTNCIMSLWITLKRLIIKPKQMQPIKPTLTTFWCNMNFCFNSLMVKCKNFWLEIRNWSKLISPRTYSLTSRTSW